MNRIIAGVGILLIVLSVAQVVMDFGPLVPAETAQVHKDESEKKSDRPDEYAKYFQERITMVGKETHGYALGYRIREASKLKNSAFRTTGLKATQWQENGPSNVPGRTRGLIILDSDPTGNTWLVGSAGGGIWKTTDSGINWDNKTEDLTNLSTSVIALCTTSPNVIYAGTGEGHFHTGSIKGDGIFKSTDSGETWSHLASTSGDIRFQNINGIIVDPNDPDILLTCSNGFPPFTSDILKSVDGGTSWTEVYNGGARIQQIINDPNDFNIQYAGLNNAGRTKGILKSTDGGDSWQAIGSGLFATERVSLAISPVNTNRLFALAESDLNSTGSEIYLSDDAGATWLSLGQDNGSANPEWLGELGWYANTILAHPFDADIAYTGGVDIYKIELASGTSNKAPKLLGYEEIGTETFMAFVPTTGLSYVGLGTGEEWFDGHDGFPIDREPGDFRAVEVRFGPGVGQKAHRFIVDPNDGTDGDGGAGVAPLGYLYQDYVDVPFEVWDIDNNQQLMVSFRDQERDGLWNLIARNEAIPALGREYILIHPVPYSTSADSEIAQDGGQGYKTIFSMWPTLAEGAVFDPATLPESKIFINYGALVVQNMNHVVINNSGGSWTPNSTGVHPDVHNMQSHSTATNTFRIIAATDGGMFASAEEADPGTVTDDWRHAFDGNNTTQFYSIDKAKGFPKYIGGTQDNGTWISFDVDPDASTVFQHKIGGDGFDAIWNYSNDDQMIGSAQYNTIRRSDDGGTTWVSSVDGLDDLGGPPSDTEPGAAPFFTVIENHKAQPDVLYVVGKSGVWKSTNFGERWNEKSITDKWVSGGGISSSHTVVISKANPNIVWAGGGMTGERNMHVSKNGGGSFSIVPNVADTLGSISGFATHPTEPNTAYALFSFAEFGKIFRTKDLGATWEDISGFNGTTSSSTGFPDVAISTLLVLPHEPATIWAGTEIGIMESTDDGQSWHELDGNVPNVSIWELRALDDVVFAATHGRGIWSTTFPTMDWPGDLEIVTGIKNESLSDIASVYPNPATDHFTIQYDNVTPGDATLTLVQSDGKVVFQKEISMATNGKIDIDTQALSSGVFVLNLQQRNTRYASRVIIQK